MNRCEPASVREPGSLCGLHASSDRSDQLADPRVGDPSADHFLQDPSAGRLGWHHVIEVLQLVLVARQGLSPNHRHENAKAAQGRLRFFGAGTIKFHAQAIE